MTKLALLYGLQILYITVRLLFQDILSLLDQKVEEVLLTVDNKTFGMISVLILQSAMTKHHIILTPIEIDDWNIVVIECKSLAAKWGQLSIYLGLSCDVIDNIKGSGDNYHCWNEALKHWIRQNYNTETFGRPSWRSLLKAMAEVDKLLFERLAAKHSQTGM